MLTRILVLALAVTALGGCGPIYFVRQPDLVAAQAGQLDPVPAQREDGGEVRLKADRLLDAQVEDLGLRMHVRPRNRRLPAGLAMLGIGAVMGTTAIVLGIVAAQPRTDCHDEGCWVPHMIAGSTLGTVGAGLLVAGGVTAGLGARDAEAR